MDYVLPSIVAGNKINWIYNLRTKELDQIIMKIIHKKIPYTDHLHWSMIKPKQKCFDLSSISSVIRL